MIAGIVIGILEVAIAFAFIPYITPQGQPSYLTIWYYLFPIAIAVGIVYAMTMGFRS
jgi:hypothetical protein